MDCTSNCRLVSHADVVLSAVTRESLSDIKCFVKYFCSNGARASDSFGRNALHMAASCGKKDVLQWLLEDGQLAVDSKDLESGWTALHRSCYYGHLSCALLLIQFGANMYEQDFEGISPVELLTLDSPRKCYSLEQHALPRRKKRSSVNIYSWGRNTNFTLGHGDEKERYTPEIIDAFARNAKVSVREAVIRKFHTLFLAENGSVWTCGHGQGGRLGHGHEKTILIPQKIDSLAYLMCIAVAAGQDHSVVLCENGSVYTFGLNKYHQMGHHPPSSQYLVPKQIQIKFIKGKKIIGIAAGTFHTIIYTGTEVFSFGLNSGQLGHLKGERTQVTPRQVSALHLKDIAISTVTCSDAATVCATDNGDIYLLYQFINRKIISKFSNLSKLLVVGGRLDDTYSREITERNATDLIVYGLYGEGKVFRWREGDKYVTGCHWSLQKPVTVSDIVCGKKLHIVTDQGEVYVEDGISAAVKKPTKTFPRNVNLVSHSSSLKQDEVIEVPLARVRHLHRAVTMACDQQSQNFVVLQADPAVGCNITPHVTPGEMHEHLTTLFQNAELEDNIHDVEIKVDEKILPCHKFILAQGGKKFRELIEDAEASTEDDIQAIPIISFDGEDFGIIREIIEFLYRGTCLSLLSLEDDSCREQGTKEVADTEEEVLGELPWNLEEISMEDMDNLQVPLSSSFFQVRDVKNRLASSRNVLDGDPHRNLPKKKNARNPLVKKRQELLRVARKFRISELVSRLQDIGKEKLGQRFHRENFAKYYDVVIEADNGTQFPCHKCILIARLEYFCIMLTSGWIESSGNFVCLKMPIDSGVLTVIIDFLYTDEAPVVKGSRDLKFLGQILTVADQLWIIRLKEICESSMASLVTLKNAAEMLEFSSLYNANQLKSVCLEFICLNICCLLEAGSLTLLSDDLQDELSKSYREMIPSMAWRVLTPSDRHLCVPWPQPGSPSKRKSSRSQRRSHASESDVSDERTMREEVENGATQKRLTERKAEEKGESSVNTLREGKRMDELHKKSILKTTDEKVQIGLWFHKNKDLSRNMDSSTLINSAGKVRAVSNPLPVCGRKNDEREERQPWGSLSPPSFDLRAIMELEKTQNMISVSQLNERKKEGTSLLVGKSRISQKERKKLRKCAVEKMSPVTDNLLRIAGSDVPKSPPLSPVQVNPWGSGLQPSRPSVSFRELLLEEENIARTNVSSPEKNRLAVPMPQESTELNSVACENSTSPSVWQNCNVPCFPTTLLKLDKIQELQKEETDRSERNKKKPLALIQIEDKAIEQLLEYYGGRFNPCELVVVERETHIQGSPNWVN